jgi:hypothetical protein
VDRGKRTCGLAASPPRGLQGRAGERHAQIDAFLGDERTHAAREGDVAAGAVGTAQVRDQRAELIAHLVGGADAAQKPGQRRTGRSPG